MGQRDLLGYGKNPPDANWPGGARVAVSLVLNVEEGSDRRISGLEQILNHMTQKGSTWFAQRHEIARHWLREHGHQTA